MKINNLVIVLCFLTTTIFGQNNPYQKDVKAIYDTIAAATTRHDWDKVLDHTYAKIFKLASREQMRGLISKTMTDTSIMKFTIISGQVDSVANDTLLVDNELFVVLYDSKKMQIVMTKSLSDPEAEREEFLSIMKESYADKYGEENVTLNKATATFDIVKKKSVNLCSNTSPTRDKGSWTIMEVKFDNPALLKKLLANEVIEWVKKH